jgi:hypothetical protein
VIAKQLGTRQILTWRVAGQIAVGPWNEALSGEVDDQVKALTHARAELDALKALAARPGLPIVYDTNMLIHWIRPCDIGWKEVLRATGRP